MLIRTTLRLKADLKKEAKKILFKSHHLGEPLDNLTRDDFYPNSGKN